MLTQVQDSYDCSGATDFVLYNAGLSSPEVDVGEGVAGASGQLENYGVRGEASGSASTARPATPSSRSPTSCSTPRTTPPSSRRACRTPTRPMTRPTAGRARPAVAVGVDHPRPAQRRQHVVGPSSPRTVMRRAGLMIAIALPARASATALARLDEASGAARAIRNGHQPDGSLLAASVAERERSDRFAALLRFAG